MAVFRIEKTRDYTVMSNHHLRNTNLSLKAKGLLSLMLSLPENWDYTTKGLAHICKDGVDSICAGVRELEEQGYVIRERVRNPNGQLGAIEYTILEQPRPPEPKQEKPERENPIQANPGLDSLLWSSIFVTVMAKNYSWLRCCLCFIRGAVTVKTVRTNMVIINVCKFFYFLVECFFCFKLV